MNLELARRSKKIDEPIDPRLKLSGFSACPISSRGEGNKHAPRVKPEGANANRRGKIIPSPGLKSVKPMAGWARQVHVLSPRVLTKVYSLSSSSDDVLGSYSP